MSNSQHIQIEPEILNRKVKEFRITYLILAGLLGTIAIFSLFGARNIKGIGSEDIVGSFCTIFSILSASSALRKKENIEKTILRNPEKYLVNHLKTPMAIIVPGVIGVLFFFALMFYFFYLKG